MSDTYSAIQALQAKLRQLASTNTKGAATAAPAAAGPIHWLATQETVLAQPGAGATGWVQYTSPQLPASATSVLLSVKARIAASVGTGYDVNIHARAAAGSTPVPIWGSHSDGVDTDTEGSVVQSFSPCSGPGFQLNVDAHVQTVTILLVGYL